MDFSLAGILAKLSALLTENGISIFAVSTFHTDILSKEEIFLPPCPFFPKPVIG